MELHADLCAHLWKLSKTGTTCHDLLIVANSKMGVPTPRNLPIAFYDRQPTYPEVRAVRVVTLVLQTLAKEQGYRLADLTDDWSEAIDLFHKSTSVLPDEVSDNDLLTLIGEAKHPAINFGQFLIEGGPSTHNKVKRHEENLSPAN